MGNQSSDQENKPAKINHLKLQNSTLIQNNEIIKAILPLQNASDFKKWEQKLAQIKPFEDQVLFLPKKHSFSQKAYCGNSGFVQVFLYHNKGLI